MADFFLRARFVKAVETRLLLNTGDGVILEKIMIRFILRTLFPKWKLNKIEARFARRFEHSFIVPLFVCINAKDLEDAKKETEELETVVRSNGFSLFSLGLETPVLTQQKAELRYGNGYLDIATSHLSESTMQGLDDSACSGITIATYEYGAFVSVPSETSAIEELECPEDLKVVLRFARANGLDLVRFDCDAGGIDGLPCFDW